MEDADDVRDLAREILTLHGYRVLEARHPGEAPLVGERRTEPIHLLLTDVVMPEMSGRELAVPADLVQRIRELLDVPDHHAQVAG